MASKISKIGSWLGMESKARSRKAGVDIAKVAGTKVPRMLFDTFGGSGIPILESAFSKWEDKRNKLAESKLRKHAVDQKYHKDTTADKSAKDMVEEARKSREDAKQASQAQAAHQQKIDAYQSAVADQGSSQIKILTNIRDELQDIKSFLRLGGRNITHNGASDGGQGGGMLGALWNLVPGKLKGKLGGKAVEIAEKLGGKRLGSLVKGAVEGLGHTAAEVAGSGLGAAAKSVAPEAAEGVAKAASGGILGRIGSFGKSALSSASGLIDSGKAAIAGIRGGGILKAGAGLLRSAPRALLGVGKGLARGVAGVGSLAAGGIIGAGRSIAEDFNSGREKWNEENGFKDDTVLSSLGADTARTLSHVGNAITFGGAGWLGDKISSLYHPGEAKLAAQEAAFQKHMAALRAKHPHLSKKTAAVAPIQSAATPEKSTLGKIASALNPIGTAQASDIPVPPVSKISGITAASPIATTAAASLASGPGAATLIKSNKKATPLEQLAVYMSGLFGLASDESKGIYVRAASTPFTDIGQQNKSQSPIPTPDNTPALNSSSMPVSGPGTIGGMRPVPSSSSVAPEMNDYSGGTSSQPGTATNGGWAPGNGSGQLHINEGGGGPAAQGGPSSIGAVPKSYGKVAGFDIDGLWEQMKGTIAQGESGKAGYNAHHGGTIPNLTNMTIGQLRHMKGAMGKYQLLPGTTLGVAARAVGLGDNDLFSPANQEAMGKYLFAMRVKRGARGGAAGIQQQLALEWASLPKDASGRGAYDGYAGNMAAGGSARGSALQSIISGGGGGAGSIAAAGGTGTADAIDAATTEVAKSDTSGNPTVVVQPQGPSGRGPGGGNAAPGTGNGVSGPMITRNSDSSVQSITQNFIAGSSAMG